MEPVRQPGDEHQGIGETRVERVQARAVAQDGEKREAEPDGFHHRDDGLVGGGTDQVAERHLQGAADHEKPGGAADIVVSPGQEGSGGDEHHGKGGGVGVQPGDGRQKGEAGEDA